jgi:hypothetical protein
VLRALAVSGAAAFLLAASAHEARASSIDDQGRLVFAPGALMTFGFESFADAQAVGAAVLTWDSSETAPTLFMTPVAESPWATSIAHGTDALEGNSALKVTAASDAIGLALLDTALFSQIAGKRVTVSMWGRAHGAEPQLEVIYPSSHKGTGPAGLAHVIAIRTGNQTSDGWAEYSTGPIDGALWGTRLASVILTARYVSGPGTQALDSPQMFPDARNILLDPSGYALIDAVEVDVAPGPPMAATPCTQASARMTCGDGGECAFGHCVDSSMIWGPAPESLEHRQELVERWEFTGEHLYGDRRMATGAPSVFAPSAVLAAEAATTPRTFFGAMNEFVTGLRDAHTTLGSPPGSATVFAPYLDPFNPGSGVFDFCLGLVENDLPGATGSSGYAVFWESPTSSLADLVQPGDLLVEVDGMTPDAWLALLEPRFRPMLPNDPTSVPTGRALILARALGNYAGQAVFSRCSAAGACVTHAVDLGQISYQQVNDLAHTSATRNSRVCSPRFLNSVAGWGPENDNASSDVPETQTMGSITAVEFDGFRGATDRAAANPLHAWEDPFSMAFAAGTGVLIDARQGHGGFFNLGNWLAENIRGTGDPYVLFAVPRGDFDAIDPAWLFDPSVASCATTNASAATVCGWTGAGMDESKKAAPPGGVPKIAWLNANDMSSSDIIAKKLQGAANLRIFGPHPTSGAFGEESSIEPPVGSWTPGSTQVFDMRFGSNFAAAMAAPWQSGTGVAPDQIVTEKMSDLLAGKDSVLEAAEEWLTP